MYIWGQLSSITSKAILLEYLVVVYFPHDLIFVVLFKIQLKISDVIVQM